jgi:hypothetical protein
MPTPKLTIAAGTPPQRKSGNNPMAKIVATVAIVGEKVRIALR